MSQMKQWVLQAWAWIQAVRALIATAALPGESDLQTLRRVLNVVSTEEEDPPPPPPPPGGGPGGTGGG